MRVHNEAPSFGRFTCVRAPQGGPSLGRRAALSKGQPDSAWSGGNSDSMLPAASGDREIEYPGPFVPRYTENVGQSIGGR